MRHRIAVMVDAFDAKYQSALVRQLRLAAAQRRTELLVYPGGILNGKTRGAAQRNTIYELVGAAAADGVILLSSTLSSEVGDAGLEKYCERLEGIPLCSIGQRLKGVPSLLVNNQQGIRQIVRHLIADHEYRRIGLIRGPLGNGEAEARYLAYCDELRAHTIDPDPALIAVGDFLQESGKKAMNVLLDRGHPVDAVVASNDYMALGALEVLAARATSLPKRIAVVGFDNIDESNLSAPSLTTVEQPLALIAETAVRWILSRLQGDPVPEQIMLETAVVIRRSCGCLTERKRQPKAAAAALRQDSGTFELRFARRQESIMAELSRAARGFFRGVSNWEASLLASLRDDLRGVPGDVFIGAVERVLRGIGTAEAEMWRFHDVLRVLRKESLSCLAEHPTELARAEDLFHAAQALTAEAVVRVQAGRRLTLERVTRLMNDLGTALAQSEDEATLYRNLTDELPKLGVERAFVALYAPGHTEPSRLAVLSYSLQAQLAGLPCPSEPYPAHELLPETIWQSDPGLNAVVLPLFIGQRDLGFALVDHDADDGSFYESLRLHVSVGLGNLTRHATMQ